MTEQQRGPIETEIHEIVRRGALAGPALLEAEVTGEMPSLDARLLQAERYGFLLLEAILRLARELDDLRAGR